MHRVLVALVSVLAIVGIMLLLMGDSAAPVVRAQEAPTPQLIALANQQPDRCEPNNTVTHPCVLQLDAVNGPFTFLPAGDQEYYSVDLGRDPGLALSVTVRSTAGLDLRTTISRAGDQTPLALISSPAISTTLSAELIGWVVLRVENRAPGLADGESYGIELRRVLPPAPTPDLRAEATPLAPDRLENNWNVETAAPVGIGVVYDLNFVCPVPWGCVGGDHDYLRVPVKAGVRYLIATFDLGPGVDTVIDLFWNDEQHLLATNDDARPGASFLSVIRWVAPANGTAIVRIAPPTGGTAPLVFDKDASQYRFAVALADSDLAHQLETRITEQTNAPHPASSGNSAPGVAPTSSAVTTSVPTMVSDAPKGPAVVRAKTTVLRDAPNPSATALEMLSADTQVILLGQASGAWVLVQTADGVVPGWVPAPDLVVVNAQASSTTPLTITTSTPAPVLSPTPLPLSQVTALEPVLPSPTPVAAHTPVSVTITIVTAHVLSFSATPLAGRTTPTSAAGAERLLASMRVQLVTVFGDVIAEALTTADGHVTLTRDVPADTALVVRIPALGLSFPLDRAQSNVRMVIPDGGSS